jgi:hypothetical protein
MLLRQRQQVVVRGRQAPVVDVEQHPPVLHHLESTQLPRAAGTSGLQHTQLVQDPLTTGLQDLPVEVTAQRGGPLHQGDLDA